MKLFTETDYERKDTNLEQIRSLVKTYIGQLGVPFVPDAFSEAFFGACCEDMVARGWSTETISALRPCLPGGVVMSCTSYAHLSNMSTRILIAHYTGILIYLDDRCEEILEELKSFSRIHSQKGKHTSGVLNAYSQILHEFPQHFGDASSLILTSSLNFINALVLEVEIPQILIPKQFTSSKFPLYVRTLSGAPEAYALFAFPPDIPKTSYIQALPDMAIIINYGNDVLSFFKEEASMEQNNVISMAAASRKVSKLQIATELKDEAVASDQMILNLLSHNKAARNTYDAFRAGYIAFHTALGRYRLHELFSA